MFMQYRLEDSGKQFKIICFFTKWTEKEYLQWFTTISSLAFIYRYLLEISQYKLPLLEFRKYIYNVS